MRVIILGDSPSKLLGKSPSLKNLWRWLDILELNLVSFTNVDQDISYVNQYDKIICLGNRAYNKCVKMTRSDKIYKLPHPSPLNRLLNDKSRLQSTLLECRMFLYRR